MAAKKLDLEKLRKDLTARPHPSEAEGSHKSQKDYGTSYKSPYSTRAKVAKRPSAPSVLVSTPKPKPVKPKTLVISKYAQEELNKTRKSTRSPSKKQEKPQKPRVYIPSIELKRAEIEKSKSSYFSGYFTKPTAPPKRPTKAAPKTLQVPGTQDKDKERELEPTASDIDQISMSLQYDTSSTSMIPPPLIPPKPAKTSMLPRPSMLVKAKHMWQAKHKAAGSVSFGTAIGATGTPNNRLSLKLDASKRRSIRDGSVDLDLEDIAEAFLDPKQEKDDENHADADYFNLMYQQLEAGGGEDSLSQIRTKVTYHEKETYKEWDATRTHFLIATAVFVILTILTICFTNTFVFHYNYGFQSPSPSITNDTVYKHLTERRFLNLHMYIMLVACLPTLQIGTLFFRLIPSISRTKMKWIHGAFQVVSSACRVFAVTFAVYYHDDVVGTVAHMYSMHSYCAILSLFLQFITLTTGIVYVLPCCTWETRVTLTPLHKNAGNIILLADSATILTGLIQIGIKFFRWKDFEEYYKFPIHSFSMKSVILNMIGLSAFFSAAVVSYLQAHYSFRRRKKPDGEKDLDAEAIHRVTERRQNKALAREARETAKHAKNDMEEAQIGSRKSFNLAAKQKFWHAQAKGKSIPALINDAEKQKSNFTDTECKYILLYKQLAKFSFKFGLINMRVIIFIQQFY